MVATNDPRLYLDANAGPPVLPLAWQAFTEATRLFANPSSAHALGEAAHARLLELRAGIARSLDATPEGVVFTSGGTEANALALLGVLRARPGAHVVTSTIEHASVQRTLEAMAARGDVRLTKVSSGRNGRLDVAALTSALTPDTALVSLVLGCNETGVLQPVRELALECKKRGVLLHTDAVQALGRIGVSFTELGVDLLSLSAHKLGGVGGVGALIVKEGVTLAPLLEGGGQELGRRAGTENLPGIAALHAALTHPMASDERARLHFLRNKLESDLAKACSDVEVLGVGEPRLCNTSCLRFPGCEGDGLMMALDLEGIAVSTGSACSSGSIEASPILMGMGLTAKEAKESLRISLTRTTTGVDTERAATTLAGLVRRMRDRKKS